MSQLDLQSSEHKERTTLFAEVLLPLPIPLRYTYRIPFQLNENVKRGCRVIIQFGKKRIITGIVDRIHEDPPRKHQAKLILDLLDEEPSVNELQLRLIDWMAGYYMCTPGEVLNAALPSGLKLSSESKVQLHPEWEDSGQEISEHEETVIDALRGGKVLGYSEISDLLNLKSIYAVLKSLIAREAVLVYEEVKDKYTPLKEKRIVLREEFRSEKALQTLFEDLSSKEKQEAVLLQYLHQVEDPASPSGVQKKSLQVPELSNSSLSTLIKNNVFREYAVQVPRFHWGGDYSPVKLSSYQEEKRDEILGHFQKNMPVLLHGVTGSGKTEIYVDLISKALEDGQQVLYLLPEIALTAQIVNRLKRSFGDNVGVYHSRFSDNERVEVWQAVSSGELNFVIGVRSSLFLPFTDLGLVIIDEEHESSYKQFSPSPRYNGRDVGIVLSQFHNARVLLGSATPSMESYYNCKTGKYGLVELNRRYGEVSLPKFEIVDIQTERKRRKVKGQFANVLVDRIRTTLDNKEQVIIFQNRRGYAPMIECEDCSYIPKCVQCSVSLTYHQYRSELRCHYCGYRESLPSHCPSCGSAKLKTVGVGTEKLEEDLTLLFPDAVVGRMDLDTTRSKSSYETIIHDFEERKIDILVGTQMLSKGLDFDHVRLVGVVDLDRMLHFPDFRAFERTFQLTVQVSGRAGRREKEGQVVIQTRNPVQPILEMIKKNDHSNFYNYEARERDLHRYPPFTRLIKITVRHRDAAASKEAARALAIELRTHLGKERVLGPEEPMVYRIRNYYLQDILVKLDRNTSNLKEIKANIIRSSEVLVTRRQYKGSQVVFDVDPL